MTEPTGTAQAPAPSTGEQTAQPTVEERLKAIEAEKAEISAKYEASVREMNAAQRDRAEYEKLTKSYELQLQQLSSLQSAQPANPVAEMDKEIAALKQNGEYGAAMDLERRRSDMFLQGVVQLNTNAQINSFNEMVEINPMYDTDTKAAFKELCYKDGKPELGLNPKMAALVQQAATSGRLGEVLNIADDMAKGRKVKTGQTEKELMQKWTAEQDKRKKEAEMASSLTQGTSGGAPPVATKEQIKEQQNKLLDDIMKATKAP